MVMQNNISNNEFESLLRRDGLREQAARSWRTHVVHDDGREVVRLLTAEVEPGRWVVGYDLYFADGRSAHRVPNLAWGWGGSERVVMLWMTGYCLSWGKFFTAEARESLQREQQRWRTLSLF